MALRREDVGVVQSFRKRLDAQASDEPNEFIDAVIDILRENGGTCYSEDDVRAAMVSVLFGESDD